MDWRQTLDRIAERTNPFLANLAIGLIILVILMAAAEHFAPQQLSHSYRLQVTPLQAHSETTMPHQD